MFDIKTERLQLRILDMRDKDALFSYRSMPEVQRFQSWRPVCIREVEDFILRNIRVAPNTCDTWLQLAVCLIDGPMIGDIGVHFLDDDQMEIGYTLSPVHQGKGYAVEAVKAVVDYAFSILGKHRITGSVDPDNLPSVRLLEKIGFRKEAHFVKSFRMDHQWFDDCVYAMLKDEWEALSL